MHQRRLVRPLLYHYQGYQPVCWALELEVSEGGGFPHPPTWARPRLGTAPPPTPAPAPGLLQVLLPASLWAASVPAHVGHPCTGFSRVTSHPEHLGPARLGSAQAHERAVRPYAGARTPQVLAPTLPPRDY